MKEELIRIAKTLELIPVNGKENLGRLLGCIQHLEALIAAVEKVESSEEMKEEGDS